ncbi:pentapeptide repeat-containing protein [Candidatus Dependentiae bacterium]|nr:pentapeptide repeat-containing protein [Candidatus Dependentiae bacterium]
MYYGGTIVTLVLLLLPSLQPVTAIDAMTRELAAIYRNDAVALTGTRNRRDEQNVSGNYQDVQALGHEAIAVNRKRNMISAADNLNVGYAGNDIGLKDRLERLGITVSEQELLTIIQNYRAFISNSRPALRKTLPNPLPPDLAASLQAGNGKFGPYLDLRGISLQGFNLSVDNVDYATERINLTGANLQGAILSGANFAGAIFDHANLADTQLSGTIFNNASLIGVNLAEQPNPVGQQWPYAIRPTGKNLASFRQADLSGSNLTNGNFYFADLTQAKLTDAILDGADFSRANLTGATLIQSPQQAIFQGDVAGSSVTDRFYDSKYFLYHDVHSGKQWKVRYDRFTTLCHTKLSPTVTLTTSQTMPCLLYRQAHPQTTT